MIQLSVCSSDELSQGIYESVRPSGGKSRSRKNNGDANSARLIWSRPCSLQPVCPKIRTSEGLHL